MKKWLCLIFIGRLVAQDSISHFNFSAYLEGYYTYDLSEPVNNVRPGIWYNQKLHNTPAVNIGMMKIGYTGKWIRGNIGLMAGTYAQYNLSTEPDGFNRIYELNGGVRLHAKHNIWADAGIMTSHLGFESAIGKDCWNVTRSLLAENSPYYETGGRLSFTSPNEKIYAAILYLNGWQRIKRLPGNITPAFGSQLTIKPREGVTFNWSTFVGNIYPQGFERWRYFNNLYLITRLTEKTGLTVGFDIGMQQTSFSRSKYSYWYSPVVIVRHRIRPKIDLALRAEYYSDAEGVIIYTGSPNGFRAGGGSFNIDYRLYRFLLLRAESRWLRSIDPVFLTPKGIKENNFFFTAAVALYLH